MMSVTCHSTKKRTPFWHPSFRGSRSFLSIVKRPFKVSISKNHRPWSLSKASHSGRPLLWMVPNWPLVLVILQNLSFEDPLLTNIASLSLSDDPSHAAASYLHKHWLAYLEGVTAPCQEGCHILGLLAFRGRSAIVVLSPTIRKHLRHRDSSAREVRVVVQPSADLMRQGSGHMFSVLACEVHSLRTLTHTPSTQASWRAASWGGDRASMQAGTTGISFSKFPLCTYTSKRFFLSIAIRNERTFIARALAARDTHSSLFSLRFCIISRTSPSFLCP